MTKGTRAWQWVQDVTAAAAHLSAEAACRRLHAGQAIRGPEHVTAFNAVSPVQGRWRIVRDRCVVDGRRVATDRAICDDAMRATGVTLYGVRLGRIPRQAVARPGPSPAQTGPAHPVTKREGAAYGP